MNTLLIPCAGKSNRFPNMKPKWMLTHPDGKLMIEKYLTGKLTAEDEALATDIQNRRIDYGLQER